MEELTHKKLKRYVVHEDLVQWDYTQLAKICCEFQSVDFLQNEDDRKKNENPFTRPSKCVCVPIRFLTFPDCSLCILVSQTFFTNIKLLI